MGHKDGVKDACLVTSGPAFVFFQFVAIEYFLS